MNSLENARERLDVIDKKIMELFEERMDVTRDVAEYKIKNNMPVLDSSREEKKLDMAAASVKNQEYAQAAREVMAKLMEVSRANQKKIIEENR